MVRISLSRALLLAAASTIVALSGLMLGAAPAAASCAGPPSPSPYAFVGVVTETRSDGRLAVVRTEDGRTVEVLGGESRSGVATSVDRTYLVGGRYEFHPYAGTSPYRDNACTATRLLQMVEGAATGATPGRDVAAAAVPGFVLPGAVAAGLVLAALATTLLARARRARRHPAATP